MIYKILQTGDWHLGRTNHSIITSTGVHTKFLDTQKSIDQIKHILKKELVNVLVFTGDWAQINKPNPQYNSAIIDILHSIEDDVEFLIFISGNHTSSPSTNYNAVSPLKSAFKKVKHYHFFYDKNINNVTYDNLNFVCVPHTNSLRSKGADDFEQIISETVSLIDRSKINILVSHFPLSNAIDLPDDTKFRTNPLSYENLSGVFKKFDLVLLGDIHKCQKLGNVFYSGSIIQNTFNEENEKKGVYIFEIDSDDKSIQENFIEVNSRIYKTINLEKIEDYKNYDPNKLSGAILRIKYSTDSIVKIIEYDKQLQTYFADCLFVIPDFTLISNNVKIASLSATDFENALNLYIEEKYKKDPDMQIIKEESKRIFLEAKESLEVDY